MTPLETVELAIKEALKVSQDPAYQQWAQDWLDAKNRSAKAAAAAAQAAAISQASVYEAAVLASKAEELSARAAAWLDAADAALEAVKVTTSVKGEDAERALASAKSLGQEAIELALSSAAAIFTSESVADSQLAASLTERWDAKARQSKKADKKP